MLVNRGILLYKGVGRWDIRFRLVVIVIRNEVLHRVMREELLKFTVELRCQGLIVSHHNGWALQLLHHMSHGEGFS